MELAQPIAIAHSVLSQFWIAIGDFKNIEWCTRRLNVRCARQLRAKLFGFFWRVPRCWLCAPRYKACLTREALWPQPSGAHVTHDLCEHCPTWVSSAEMRPVPLGSALTISNYIIAVSILFILYCILFPFDTSVRCGNGHSINCPSMESTQDIYLTPGILWPTLCLASTSHSHLPKTKKQCLFKL